MHSAEWLTGSYTLRGHKLRFSKRIFTHSLNVLQSKNAQCSATTPALFLNQNVQIAGKSASPKAQFVPAQGIDATLSLEIIEKGELRSKTAQQIWIAKYVADSHDNLRCIAAVLEDVLVVKTVMHHFTWELPS